MMKEIRIENEFLIVDAIEFGCRIINIFDKKSGKNLIASYENTNSYLTDEIFMGSILVGRAAGRTYPREINIKGNSISLEDTGDNIHLHGGTDNLACKYYTLDKVSESEMFFHLLEKGSENNPGDLLINLKISLVSNQVAINIDFKSDYDIYLNPCVHLYYKLFDFENSSLQAKCKKFYEIENNHLIKSERNILAEKQISRGISLQELKKLHLHPEYLINNPLILKDNVIYLNNGFRNLEVSANINECVIYCPTNGIFSDTICLEFQYLPNTIHTLGKEKVILEKNVPKSYEYTIKLVN